MSVIVGWLVSANCADTLTVLGDKFVIGKEFLRPWNRKITTNWEKWLPKNLFRDHTRGRAITPTVSPMDPPLLPMYWTSRGPSSAITLAVATDRTVVAAKP